MFYVTTSQKTGELPDTMDPADTVILFGKATDVFHVEEVQHLLSLPTRTVEFTTVKDREDMLVCLGALLSGHPQDRFLFLDSSLPVPARYASQVQTVKKAARKRSRKSTSSGRIADKPNPAAVKPDPEPKKPDPEPKNPKPAAKKPEPVPVVPDPVYDEPDPVYDDDLKDLPFPELEAEKKAASKPKPVRQPASATSGIPENLVPHETTDIDFKGDAFGEALYRLIGIKSEDVTFFWPTPMLYSKIENALTEADSDEEIRMGLTSSIRNGEKIWRKLKPHLEEVKAIVTKYKH